MKTSIRRIQYAGSSWGDNSELIIIEFEFKPEKDESDINLLRQAVDKIAEVKEVYSTQEFVYSPYDCTGQAFGSRFKKLDLSSSEDGFTVLIIHSWAVDI